MLFPVKCYTLEDGPNLQSWFLGWLFLCNMNHHCCAPSQTLSGSFLKKTFHTIMLMWPANTIPAAHESKDQSTWLVSINFCQLRIYPSTLKILLYFPISRRVFFYQIESFSAVPLIKPKEVTFEWRSIYEKHDRWGNPWTLTYKYIIVCLLADSLSAIFGGKKTQTKPV